MDSRNSYQLSHKNSKSFTTKKTSRLFYSGQIISAASHPVVKVIIVFHISLFQEIIHKQYKLADVVFVGWIHGSGIEKARTHCSLNQTYFFINKH